MAVRPGMRGTHTHLSHGSGGVSQVDFGLETVVTPCTACPLGSADRLSCRGILRILPPVRPEGHVGAHTSGSVCTSPPEGMMSTFTREAGGRLRRLSSARWQARSPAPDGAIHTARTEDDKPLTFLNRTDARTWLAGVHTKIARSDGRLTRDERRISGPSWCCLACASSCGAGSISGCDAVPSNGSTTPARSCRCAGS
jgi:hypothetical protein